MRLLNIDWLRPLVVLLIVINHVFAIYSGVWESPWNGIDDNVEVYKWVQRIAICCSLQLFTFISGYIYGFQISNKGLLSFRQLAQKKTKRLLYPYLIFGSIYYLIISSKGNVSLIELVSSLINGIGHLWFLLMLFFVFLIHWMVYKIEKFIKNKLHNNLIATTIIMVMLFCLYIIAPVMPNTLCIKQAFMYLIYFYIGQKTYENFLCIKLKPSAIFLSVTSYIFMFVIYYSILDNESVNIPYLIHKVIDFLTRLSGICFFYILSLRSVKKNKSLSNFYSKLISLSFGVYIYHQFIIVYIYERTIIPELYGVHWTPFICLGITLLISYILSILSSKAPIIRGMI